jgi:hypothetical protein
MSLRLTVVGKLYQRMDSMSITSNLCIVIEILVIFITKGSGIATSRYKHFNILRKVITLHAVNLCSGKPG